MDCRKDKKKVEMVERILVWHTKEGETLRFPTRKHVRFSTKFMFNHQFKLIHICFFLGRSKGSWSMGNPNYIYYISVFLYLDVNGCCFLFSSINYQVSKHNLYMDFWMLCLDTRNSFTIFNSFFFLPIYSLNFQVSNGLISLSDKNKLANDNCIIQFNLLKIPCQDKTNRFLKV